MMRRSLVIVLILCAAFSVSAYGDWIFDFEGGAAFNGYNDIGIPGDTGTRFDLSEGFDVPPKPFWRVRVSFLTPNQHHFISLLAAPLRFSATGTAPEDISFAGETFMSGTPLEGTYRFDSYRLTWRYNWYPSETFTFGLGLTAKIRDAAIALEGGGQKGEKTNTGFVPLINFSLRWWFHEKMNLLFEGDALAAPQGRAEDVFLGLQYYLSPDFNVRLGYRVVEGGGDNDEVYNFTIVHYASAGIELRL